MALDEGFQPLPEEDISRKSSGSDADLQGEKDESCACGARRPVVSVVLLTMLSFFTMFDRYVTAGILNRLEEYYGISNTWGGLLQTFYVVVYVVCLLSIGVIGDRTSRKKIILVSNVMWIIFMIASSFIPKNMFWLFAVVRSLTSVGMATVNALAPSLFADYFSGSGRRFSLMIYYMSFPIGATISVAFGTALADTEQFLWSMRLCPAIAILLLLLSFYFLEDAVRGGVEEAVVESNDVSVIQDAIQILKVKSYWLACLPPLLVNFSVCSTAWWNATLLSYAMNSTGDDPSVYHGIPYDQWIGIMSVPTSLLGIVAPLIGVYISEAWREGRLYCKPQIRSPAIVVGIGCLIEAPFDFAYLLLINKEMIAATVMTSASSLVGGGLFPLSTELVLLVTSPSRRALAISMMNVMQCVTGDGPAPFIAGYMTDLFLGGSHNAVDQFAALQKTMLIFNGIATTSFIFAFINAFIFPREMISSSKNN